MGFATLKGLLSYQIGFGGRRWLYLWFQPTLGTEKHTAHGWSGTYYYIVIHIYQFLLFLIKDYRLANMMGLSSQLEGSCYKYLEMVSRQTQEAAQRVRAAGSFPLRAKNVLLPGA